MSRADARAPKIRNRAPAPIQITAEQLLREAQERQEEGIKAPRQRVEDFEELHEYRGRKRKEFEDQIRRTRNDIRAWTKYATWEASQAEFARARSVFERALDVEPTSVKLWLSYTEMELKARNVQHGRNLFDRVVTLLPRIDQIWYKYVYLEELLGNVPGARQVFERWMAWEPDEKAWSAYIKMEVRYQEMERASAIYERLVACHPEPKLWIKWAKFEEERGKIDRAREIYQMAFEFFGSDDEEQIDKSQSIYTAFAKLEIRQKEYDRARTIYKFALDRLPRSKSSGLYASYAHFEKQFGDRAGVEATVLGKRRIQYEEELANGGTANYDVWFDYARLEEDALREADEDPVKGVARVREVYERAVAQVPPPDEKRYWRRYIFLWLYYAAFEELETKDYDRARQVFEAALKLIPHKRFTFSKVWIQYAQFEIRRQNVDKARKIMGAAIGASPKPKSFKAYIELELRLLDFERCRKLYQKFLEFDPADSTIWIKFAQLETELRDVERARALYELAVQQPELEMPELVWKAYIQFEEDEDEYDNARKLYERLLERTGHVKVWVTYAKFELQWGQTYARRWLGEDDEDEDEEEEAEEGGEPVVKAPKPPPTEEQKAAAEQSLLDGVKNARKVFERGYQDLKSKGLKEGRVALLEAWENFEALHGDAVAIAKVKGMKPRTVRRTRQIDDAGNKEEYYDVIFPDDESNNASQFLKFMQTAAKWKAAQATAPAAKTVAASEEMDVDAPEEEEEA